MDISLDDKLLATTSFHFENEVINNSWPCNSKLKTITILYFIFQITLWTTETL